MRYSEEGLYRLLEKLLRAAKEPKNCNELFDVAEVREYAASPNRVSDYLGNMWRRGLLRRVPETDPGRGPRSALALHLEGQGAARAGERHGLRAEGADRPAEPLDL